LGDLSGLVGGRCAEDGKKPFLIGNLDVHDASLS
jgi:hypothetical protein